MGKRKDNAVEDKLFVAERQYSRMMENVSKGILDKDEIASAMTVINAAHYMAIKQNKMYLIK